MKYTLLGLLLFVLITGSVHAGTPPPSPTPAPPPADTMPAGDPSVTLPAPAPEPPPEPEPLPTLEAGPAELAVRVCIDLDGDNACGAREGITGMPVVIFDAATGDMLADGKTNEMGTYRAPIEVRDGMDLSAAALPLGLSSQIWDPRRGVVLMLPDVPIFPVRLP